MKYTDENRSQIQNEERAKQLIVFDGMNVGMIGLTDTDAWGEYHDLLFYFFEVKGRGTDFNDCKGQDIAFKRLTKRVDSGGAYAVFYHCYHDVKDPHEKIFLKDTQVIEGWWQGRWIPAPRYLTAKQVFNHAIDWAKRMEKYERGSRL